LNGRAELQYHEVLQRACAILLLVFVSFSLISPEAFATSDSTLPACCRRDGKHHCASMYKAHQQQPASSPVVKSGRQCSSFPTAGAIRTFFNHDFAGRLSSVLCLNPHPSWGSSAD